MYVLLSPQRDDRRLEYSFDGNRITVTYIDEFLELSITETLDLTDVQSAEEIVVNELPINPVISIEHKEDGMYVQLLNYHGPNPPDNIAYPEWMEV